MSANAKAASIVVDPNATPCITSSLHFTTIQAAANATPKEIQAIYSSKRSAINLERRIEMNGRKKVNLLWRVRQWTLTEALVGGVVLLFSTPGGAQSTPEKGAPNTASVVATPSEKPSPAVSAQSPANGKAEGIKVHGHWAIEVRNPDGTVVTHREFENSLTPPTPGQVGGAGFLSQILGRQNSVGLWILSLSSLTSQPCIAILPTGGPPTPKSCDIYETGTALVSPGCSGGSCFATMSVSSGTTGLVLSGTAVAEQNGTIDQVSSGNFVCASSVTPSTCTLSNSGNLSRFTTATLASPINVSVGQSVAVTVTFTFA